MEIKLILNYIGFKDPLQNLNKDSLAHSLNFNFIYCCHTQGYKKSKYCPQVSPVQFPSWGRYQNSSFVLVLSWGQNMITSPVLVLSWGQTISVSLVLVWSWGQM